MNPQRHIKTLLAAAMALLGGIVPMQAQAQFAYVIKSSPEGIITTNNGSGAPGSTLTTPQPPIVSGDNRFSRWTLDGTPLLTSSGPAKGAANVTLDHEGLTLIAVYLPSAQDSDSDTIPDWEEWRDFGSLTNNTSSNPDADAFITNVERARGWSPSLPDLVTQGGVFRGSSVATRYHNPANNYRYTVTSSPTGFIQETGEVPHGTVYTTPNPTSEVQAYMFTHWTVDGIRQTAPDGSAKTRVQRAVDHDDMHFVAHFVLASADTDADGIKDWMELRHFGDLDETSSSDPDGDSLSIERELARGYSPSIDDLMTEGGVFRSGSASLNYHDPTQIVYYEMKSNPVGLVAQTGLVPTNTVITTPNLTGETQGYMLGYWTVNGVQQRTANGLARTQLNVTLSSDYMQIVAHFFTTTSDSDSDGIRDWIEYRHFGDLDNGVADDADGDGWNIGTEQQRGYAMTVPDLVTEGGVFRNGSVSIKYRDPAEYKLYSLRSSPPGFLRDEQVVLPGAQVETPNQYGEFQGYRFSHWTVNGVRQASPNGIARTQLKLTMNEDLDVVGYFTPKDQDSDGDTLPDWYELFHFGNLDQNATTNADGDGFNGAQEYARGTGPAVVDLMQEGGVFRSASRSVSVYRAPVLVPYVIRSEPQGLITRQEAAVTAGTVVQSPLLNGSTQGFTFAYWSVNGVRQISTTGRSLNRVSVTLTGATDIIAHYFADNADTDGDGLKDWMEWNQFGTLANGPTSNPDGDGFTVAQEDARGLAPRIGDIMQEGGVFRSASKSVLMQLAAYNIYHPLTVTIDPPGAGAVHGGGSYKQGVTARLEATTPPGVNGMFSHWSGDLTGSDNPAFLLMDAPHAVTAHFTVATYTLKYGTTPNGSVIGTSPQSVPPGGNGTQVEAVPNTGYHFTEWSDGVTQNPRTETNVNAPVDVVARFAINVYAVTFDLGTLGTRTGGGELLQNIEHGSAATAPEVQPALHYLFTGWSTAFSNVTGHLTVTAQYQRITHTIAAVANPPQAGSITGDGTHNEGDSATVTVTRNTGWKFLGWSEGGAPVSTEAGYTFEVTGPRSLVAEFEPLIRLIDPGTKTASLSAQSYTIDITSNTTWGVASVPPWAVVAPTSGAGNGSVLVTVAANNNALARSGVITFSGFELAPLDHSLTQLGGIVKLSHSHAGYSKAKATGSISVTTSHYGLVWTAVSNDPAWLHVTAGAAGAGNGKVSYTVDAYDGKVPREGTLTIGGQTFTVMQSATVPTGQLTVQITGSGTVTGAKIGTPVSKPVGSTVTLVATPRTGQRFTGWTGTGFIFPPGGEKKTTLAFKMGKTVNLTATFEVNPYAGINLAGTYVGVAEGTDLSDTATNGRCTFTLTSTGSFTCAFKAAGGSYSGTGKLTSDHQGRSKILRTGKEPVFVDITFDRPNNTADVVARLASDIGPVLWTSETHKKYVKPAVGTHPAAGRYTSLFTPEHTFAADFGTGYATVVISSAGVATFTGKLPDGAALTTTSTADLADGLTFFIPLYANKGFIVGRPLITTGTGITLGGDLHWVKKPLPTSVIDSYYRNGFDLDVSFEAEKYVPLLKPVLDIPLTADNLRFHASGAGLTANPLTRLLTLSTTSTANVFKSSDDPKLKITLTNTTGVFTASFVHDTTLKTLTGYGILLQGSKLGGGVFRSVPKAGALSIAQPVPPW